MIKAIRNLTFLMSFAALAAGCGGSSGGGGSAEPPPPGGGNEPGPGGQPDPVSIEQLEGTWFGTFDRTNSSSPPRVAMQLTIENVEIEGGETTVEITAIRFNDNPEPSDFTGPITATEGSANGVFHFELTNRTNTQQKSHGVLFVDPAATAETPPAYLVFLNNSHQMAVLQKDATAPLPGWTAGDLDDRNDDGIGSWAGNTFKTDTGGAGSAFGAFTREDSEMECTSATDESSQCNGTVGANARRVDSFRLDDPTFGRWHGDYSDALDGGTSGENGTIRAYLSPDKNFAGAWACEGLPGSFDFPAGCDFLVWNKQ